MGDIIINGSLQPSTIDTPIDKRARVENISELSDIAYPYVGLRIYVRDSGHTLRVTSLKAKDVMGVSIPNAVIDGYVDETDALNQLVNSKVAENKTEVINLVNGIIANMREDIISEVCRRISLAMQNL